ncbi:phenol hydroxylase subunit [Rhodoblastus acidophilus]|uniref:Phenol hydroxylase subunit n=1 Tax=Candidatus Rhodoblastus alkanivorans TaxID=2954117 RepID=A0ABS9Z5A7_9HYPH|nr:phenol hydroxylase subunit [Candidatus Rhodoblastus alkanivorans]MCI4679984.1 phenol hydroxylase subunit [Candidatus Rhodoblastus alkanivorans]MCI4682367.1 phenol hydroxylase subunit [Candidatus Rhodoblastus alkanivorans]MDI4639670.1 phenol hydroxylase subunit [Rhodoblastus acidophilus]
MAAPDAGAGAPGRESFCGRKTQGGAFARILGVRLGRFVEFEFFLDDGLLSVELILPLDAFHEFCREQMAEILPPSDVQTASDIERLAWREKQPGLLRPRQE